MDSRFPDIIDRTEQKNHQPHPYRYVGHVKNVGAQLAHTEIDKIDHASERDPVEQVAEAAPAKQRQTENRQHCQPRTKEQEQDNKTEEYGYSNGDDSPAPHLRQSSFKTEFRSFVLVIIKAQHTAGDMYDLGLRQMRLHHIFCDLVASDNQEQSKEHQKYSLPSYHGFP
jgi:hypothetical protein